MTAFPSGAHVAEVEIDTETGAIYLINYVAVDDCGRVLNHAMVEGQMHGGIVQGIGPVICEQGIYDENSGQLLTGSFMDYGMPRADNVPMFQIHDRSVPSPTNPLGAKGTGEAGTTGAIPTLANAVINALEPIWVYHLDLPMTPERY